MVVCKSVTLSLSIIWCLSC